MGFELSRAFTDVKPLKSWLEYGLDKENKTEDELEKMAFKLNFLYFSNSNAEDPYNYNETYINKWWEWVLQVYRDHPELRSHVKQAIQNKFQFSNELLTELRKQPVKDVSQLKENLKKSILHNLNKIQARRLDLYEVPGRVAERIYKLSGQDTNISSDDEYQKLGFQKNNAGKYLIEPGRLKELLNTLHAGQKVIDALPMDVVLKLTHSPIKDFEYFQETLNLSDNLKAEEKEKITENLNNLFLLKHHNPDWIKAAKAICTELTREQITSLASTNYEPENLSKLELICPFVTKAGRVNRFKYSNVKKEIGAYAYEIPALAVWMKKEINKDPEAAIVAGILRTNPETLIELDVEGNGLPTKFILEKLAKLSPTQFDTLKRDFDDNKYATKKHFVYSQIKEALEVKHKYPADFEEAVKKEKKLRLGIETMTKFDPGSNRFRFPSKPKLNENESEAVLDLVRLSGEEKSDLISDYLKSNEAKDREMAVLAARAFSTKKEGIYFLQLKPRSYLKETPKQNIVLNLGKTQEEADLALQLFIRSRMSFETLEVQYGELKVTPEETSLVEVREDPKRKDQFYLFGGRLKN